MTQQRLRFQADDERATELLGQALARVLPPGSVIALEGTLGAGKTRLVQAVAAALGIDRRDVVSPTFVLVQEYRGDRTIYHIDAYRVRDDDEFLELGVDELFLDEGLVFVEWSDRVESCLPPERLEISIEVTGSESRRIEVVGRGTKYQGVVTALEGELTRPRS